MNRNFPKALLLYGSILLATICASLAGYFAWRCSVAEAKTRNVILYATCSTLGWNKIAVYLRDNHKEYALASDIARRHVYGMNRYKMYDKKSAIIVFDITEKFPELEADENIRDYILTMKNRWTGKSVGSPDVW